MVVFGGKIGGGLISPHLFEFSFATQEWSRLGSAAQPLSPSARLQAIDPVAPTEGVLFHVWWLLLSVCVALFSPVVGRYLAPGWMG